MPPPTHFSGTGEYVNRPWTGCQWGDLPKLKGTITPNAAGELKASLLFSERTSTAVDKYLCQNRWIQLIKEIRKTNKKVKLLVVSMHEETLNGLILRSQLCIRIMTALIQVPCAAVFKQFDSL